MDEKKIKEFVKEAYGKIAQQKGSCSCGCGVQELDAAKFAKSVGYSQEELSSIPQEANMALSCGNPTALASLKEGEVVLDLGSGAGFDCFIASRKVGKGHVIGVDMTPEMVQKARGLAKKNGVENVEFRLGEIEHLPVEDNSVDVVLSNCVINLSADKPSVFKEIYRVLKIGGRVAISDIALLKDLPEAIKESIKAYTACVGGAVLLDTYKRMVEESGLKDVKVTVKGFNACAEPQDPLYKLVVDGLGEKDSLQNYVVSVAVEGCK